MNDIFKPFISTPRFSEYIPVSKYKNVITPKQAFDDLNVVRYLMENRYCGWEYYQNRGIIWDTCFQKIENFIISHREIYISDFCRAIHSAFDIGIVDNHLSFCSPLTGRLSFSKQFTAYFADFKVMQRGDAFYAIDSKCSQVIDGDIINAPGNLYPTLYNQYLVGIRSFTPIKDITISVNGKSTSVPLHRCRAIKKTESSDVCLRYECKNGIDTLRSNCCDYVGNISEKTNFVEIGKQFKKNNVLILNYLSNDGGYNRITREFIQGLNDYSYCQEYSIRLESPVTEQKSCDRQWITLSEAGPYDFTKATFDGKLIMLVNSDTASSGESAVLYARSCKNLLLIGENTMGCNTFGNVASYELEHSHIICRIPNTINLCQDPEDCIEGYGFSPNYWVDSDDVEGEVIKWIKNNKELI